MNSYYLTVVLQPELDDKKKASLLETVKKTMLGQEGKLKKEDTWGSRDLAYPINHQSKGFYVHFEFEADPEVAKDIDKKLKVEEDIMRYLLVRA